ncbi:MMPL family transporter [Gordonia insulae]|uniref:Trehalose monomycolate exporter MmpL3 n=1 Tax=Gordonia insulae TaxID=2420509 RepID=A0A3G8JKS0_9ACTN|nr:MMPL family transporter [Gordonia insulae]AZG45029.1 Trehalose monomycolate exporter MmpL3 [Gordonia insulae]
MPARLTRFILKMPRAVLGVAFLVLILAGLYGATAAQHLLAGGYSDPGSESSRADRVLEETFDRGGLQVVVKLDGPAGMNMATDPTAREVGTGIVGELETVDHVQRPILSVWQNPDLAPALVSEDSSSALIVLTLAGGEDDAPAYAQQIDERFTGERQGISVRVGGQGLVFSQVNAQTTKDLAVAEGIAIPISFVVLIVVFGGLVAAALPVVIGIVAIVGTFALLRLIAEFTDVSIFALNLTTALGLALAIDYTLLIVTRYREEVTGGAPRPAAIATTMATAGRTVAFSAVTVALSLAALAIFPMYFLRSFAYAGVGVVIVASLAALVLTPAILMVLGPRVDALDVRRPLRRIFRRPTPAPRAVEETRWYRLVQFVLRHALPVALVVTTLLLVLGAPFLGIRFGFPDDRVLPPTASSHAIQQEIRDDFAQNMSASVTVVASGLPDGPTLAGYTAALSEVEQVDSASSSAGTFVDGRQVGPGDPANTRGTTSLISVSTDLEPMRDEGLAQLDRMRAVAVPAGVGVLFTGLAATNQDTVNAIYDHLPWVLTMIALATFVLLFLFTGSVVLPLKALVLNVLSLSATFGAMVWFFQDGHLGGLGTTATGYLVATIPVLMFCIAFGLSMDYEVFLLGRIREEWLDSDGSREGSDHAVAVGIARTGRVVTAAALLMSIVFAGIAASEVSFMRMFGVGLTLAVLMDATLIRMLLVPAFMRLAGRANWWAPGPLRRLHDRIGLSESISTRPSVPAPAGTSVDEESRVEHDETDQVAPRFR